MGWVWIALGCSGGGEVTTAEDTAVLAPGGVPTEGTPAPALPAARFSGGDDVLVGDLTGTAAAAILVVRHADCGASYRSSSSPTVMGEVFLVDPGAAAGTVAERATASWEGPECELGGFALPGDLTGDGVPDLTAYLWGHGDAATLVLPAPPTRNATVAPIVSVTGAALGVLPCGDLDGDGAVDLCTYDRWFRGPLLTDRPADEPTTLFSDLAGVWVGTSLAADLTGDGLPEVALGDDRDHPEAVLLVPGTVTGTTTTAEAAVAVWQGAAAGHVLAAGDLDGDGRSDLVMGVYEGLVVATEPDGGPLWEEPITLVARHAGAPSDPETGDLDGDGQDDLAVVVRQRPPDEGVRVIVWMGPLTPGLWTDEVAERAWSATAAALAIGDLDGDADEELVVLGADGLVVDAW